jgi:hypothetical protein
MLRLALVVALGALAIAAGAGSPSSPFSSPRIEPGAPTNRDRVVYSVDWQGCGYLYPPTVSRDGNAFLIQQNLSATCGLPLAGQSEHYSLGVLGPGVYSVHLETADPDVPGYQYPSPEDLAFTVIQGAAMPINAPTLGDAALLAVAGLLAAIGAAVLRERGHS